MTIGLLAAGSDGINQITRTFRSLVLLVKGAADTAASALIRFTINRPDCMALASGLRGERPAAIASAFTYSNTPNKVGRRLKAPRQT
nr:hypothetical protein [Acaryochloris sp. IP29b_bin.148]